MREVIFVGHIALDRVIHAGTRPEWRVGGAVVYSSYTAALLGLRSRIVSAVGEDFPEKLMSRIEERGVDTRLVRRRGLYTTRFFLRYRRSGGRSLSLLSRAESITADDVPHNSSKTLAALPIANEFSREAFAALCRRFPTVVLDPQGFCRHLTPGRAVRTKRWTPPRSCQNLKLLKFSEAESEALRVPQAGHVATSLSRLSGYVSRHVILTRGVRGLIALIRGGFLVRMPSFPARPERYPTGAGDVLLGAYLACSSTGRDIVQALAYASSVASIHVERNMLSLSKLPSRLIERRAGIILKNMRCGRFESGRFRVADYRALNLDSTGV
jgi:sugar/nucleoside kinase (ribokinase family)